MAHDAYAGAAVSWATGASLVYRPIAGELLARAPHPLSGRLVLDVGAGTGVGSDALITRGARVLAADRSPAMLGWSRETRPASSVADVVRLPFRSRSVDDAYAAFVLNHIDDPVGGLRELVRVTRPGGAVLANTFSSSSASAVRDRVDEVALAHGWEPPSWYLTMREVAIPLLADPSLFAAAASAAGLTDVRTDEAPVDVGVTRPEDLVDYRFGQAQFSAWQDGLGAAGRAPVRAAAVEAIASIMEPYRPIVVFLAARVP